MTLELSNKNIKAQKYAWNIKYIIIIYIIYDRI